MSNVFINRTLNMKKISHIGFDMDHTLVRYQSANFEALAYKIMTEKLVETKGYPPEILVLSFRYNSALRGLVIDKERGNILKLSRYGSIRSSRHGLQQIDFKTQKKIYTSLYLDLNEPEYDSVDTAFSISLSALFAQIVDLKDNNPNYKIPSYASIAKDLNDVLNRAHSDGSIKSIVQENLERYIVQDEEVVEGLQRYIKHGKKIFVVTNSDYGYTKALLEYAIDPFLEKGKTWRDLFSIVITLAQKPRFFHDTLGFLKVDPETGTMTNLDAEKLEIGGIYQGGSARQFTRDLGIDFSEILYVGDHIYGDILRLKKDCEWRTALVIEELDQEIANNKKAETFAHQINKLMAKKIPIEQKLDMLISKNIESGTEEDQDIIDQLIKQISAIDAEVGPLIKQQDKIYNPYWGQLMRAGIEESYFADQVERYACIYMAKLSDFLKESPRTYFRSPQRLMAHDLHEKGIV